MKSMPLPLKSKVDEFLVRLAVLQFVSLLITWFVLAGAVVLMYQASYHSEEVKRELGTLHRMQQTERRR